MRYFIALAALMLALPSLALGHSLESVESELGDKEKYFQPVGRPAPDFALQDAWETPFSLADFRDKVVVVHFIYASCEDACPLHAQKLAQIQEMVNTTPMREQVQFISITTNPVHDTPEVLADYGRVHGLAPANWVFLTSGAERPHDTRKLAEQFGHNFMPLEDGNQVHGVVTHIIDQEGTLQANFHGLKFEPSNLVIYLNALINNPPGSEHPHELSLWDRLKSAF